MKSEPSGRAPVAVVGGRRVERKEGGEEGLGEKLHFRPRKLGPRAWSGSALRQQGGGRRHCLPARWWSTGRVLSKFQRKWVLFLPVQNYGIHGGSDRGGALALPGPAGGPATVGTRDVFTPAKTPSNPSVGSNSAPPDGILDRRRHLIVLSPSLSEGKDIPIKVDIEYEWLPLRCTQCCSLGHTVAACPETRVARLRPPVAVYVQKHQSKGGDRAGDSTADVATRCDHVEVTKTGRPTLQHDMDGSDVDAVLATQQTNISYSSDIPMHNSEHSYSKGKEIVVYNSFALLNPTVGEEEEGIGRSDGFFNSVGQLVRDRGVQVLGILETRVRRGNVQLVRSGLLPGWRWFDDYSGPGSRIWLAWDELEVGVEILRVAAQIIHCRLLNKRTSTTCLMSVVYGECDTIRRRLLWAELVSISADMVDIPWCVLGDFNVVVDASESCGTTAEVTQAMNEFRDFISEAGLTHMPYTGCPFTWHNCSTGSRSLWRRLDRVLVNDNWLLRWPHSSYLSALPQTSDHSPLILLGAQRRAAGGLFRFDNFLASQPGFLQSVRHVWCHSIYGTKMYEVTRKLKALKPLFRAQRKNKGDLANNVNLAKRFLDQAQSLFDTFKGGCSARARSVVS
ncbi:UNVERIFIED_CONTAM: hypothetical protein Sradi_7078300 [Sesamum radiatum]|uniref:Endonuclease/exonuclease/phosphatase domain-containing protein n=1 Tax=Sesamum radiatum TaxID=300843 RepID=A0AAW2J6M9_SESRA